MQLLFRRPKAEQHHGEDEELDLVRRHRPELFRALRDAARHCARLARQNFVGLRRHHPHQQEIERDAHRDRERRADRQPVEPRNLYMDRALHQRVDIDILRRAGRDPHRPDQRQIADRHHQHAGDAALFVDAAGRDQAENDRRETGDAGRRGRNEEGEQRHDEDGAEEQAAPRRPEEQNHLEGNAPVEPGDRHGRRDNQRRRDQRHGRIGETVQGRGQRGAGAERPLGMRRIRRDTEQKGDRAPSA